MSFFAKDFNTIYFMGPSNKRYLNISTLLGALAGFIVTRFLEDGNLLVTNAIVLIAALGFRTIAKTTLLLLKKVQN